MDDAVSNGVFAGGSILVSIWGEKIFRADSGLANIYRGTAIDPDTIYGLGFPDQASRDFNMRDEACP